MLRFQPSIRQKIRLGYFAIVAIMVGLSVATFVEVRYLEKKVIFGAVISEFFDTTLEIRRFEKNYFLYKQRSDYVENMKYLAKAQELLERNIGGFETIASSSRILALQNDLKRYRELIEQYADESLRQESVQNTPLPPVVEIRHLETRIREIGKGIITRAEEISKTERQSLQAMLSMYRTALILSIIALVFLTAVVGGVLSRMVVKPLKLLEESMKVISEGKFERVSLDSKEREILSLVGAFNRVLKELELRQRHLIQSEKLASLGTLLSGVAHELNNPLSNISSSCQILMEEIDENDKKYREELLAQIDEQTDRARNIVRSLLEFSRDKEFKKEPLNLNKLFEETIRFLRGQIPTKVEITLAVPDEITIVADKQRMQQAFLNLIKNALEALGSEGAIMIKAQKHRAVDKTEKTAELFNYLKYRGKCTFEDDTIDIEIRDTGSGIPTDILSRIFDPFFTTKDVGKGSGLGLFIVHEIIEENDGCIAVDSEVGKGTSFLISLPTKE
ncbi:MAG TPA: ATP-binding protein [Thermodesulfovibrionales bacterium]|nr:ATP-binding protein [Thermodesulfovibrionales bacterium]